MSERGPLLLKAQAIHKSYPQGQGYLEILKGLDLDLHEGEDLCITGSSGSGKSTLLHILGSLDRPTLGKVFFRGEDLFAKSDQGLAQWRNRALGFVFQFHHLMSEFSAVENVMMPCLIHGDSSAVARSKAERLLRLLGLTDRQSHFPSQLSGGEQQRVAVARALVMEPKILFADEPTGNLDSANGQMIGRLFFDLKKELGLTLVVVTHDMKLADSFSRRLMLEDGCWRGDPHRPST